MEETDKREGKVISIARNAFSGRQEHDDRGRRQAFTERPCSYGAEASRPLFGLTRCQLLAATSDEETVRHY